MLPFEVGLLIAAESCVSGDVRECSIPNIMGNQGSAGYANVDPGAFFNAVPVKGTAYPGTVGTNYASLGFDASRSNSIYGKSDVIQPPAFQTLIIIKV